MPRHLGAAIAACLYIAVSAWLVGTVGRAHREMLEAGGLTGSQSRAVPGKRRAAREEPPRRHRHRPRPGRSDVPLPPHERSPALARANPVPHRLPSPPRRSPDRRIAPTPPRSRRPSKTTGAKPSAADAPEARRGLSGPRRPIEPVFRDSPGRKKRWDLPLNPGRRGRSSARPERDGAAPAVQPACCRMGSSSGGLYDAADPLLEKSLAQGDRVQVTFVLDSKAINAFSHPGWLRLRDEAGCSTGSARTTDYLLQFALAHEIYHVDQGHALRCLPGSGIPEDALRDGAALLPLHLSQ